MPKLTNTLRGSCCVYLYSLREELSEYKHKIVFGPSNALSEAAATFESYTDVFLHGPIFTLRAITDSNTEDVLHKYWHLPPNR